MVGVRNGTAIILIFAFPIAILFSGACVGMQPPSDFLLVVNDAENQKPGRIDVTREEAERALDRSLVEVGAILLDSGRLEVAPSLRYGRREESTLSFIKGYPLRTRVSLSVLSRKSFEYSSKAIVAHSKAR